MSAFIRWLYALARGLLASPRAEQFKRRARVRHAAEVLRQGFLTESPLAFASRELAPGRRRAGAYLPRGARDRVWIRHRTEDRNILEEVFGDRLYEMPPAVVQMLAAIERPIRVLDLGAHVGLFGAWARSRFPEVRIVAVEADPANAAALRRTVALNGAHAQWEVREAAGAAAHGSVIFRGEGGTGGHVVAGSQEGAGTVPAIDVLPLMTWADVVKMDIEGGEWDLLTDPRFRAATRPQALAIEVHPHLAPTDDWHAGAHELMQAGGFAIEQIAGGPAGAAMFWAYRLPQSDRCGTEVP